MAKNKTNDNKRISFFSTSYSIKRSDKTGTVTFKTEIYDSKGTELAAGEIVAPLLTAWVDEESMKMVKCHFILPVMSKNRKQAKIAREVLSVLLRNGPQAFGSGSSYGSAFDLSANTEGLCCMSIRHGSTYTEYEKATYSQYIIVDNKSAAVERLILEMKSHVTVGGMKLVDFSVLDEDILLEIGCEKIIDQVGRGLPMWKFQPAQIIKGSIDQYVSYWKRDELIKENCTKILDLIRDYLAA